jgi:hypothetical protein
MRPLRAVLVMYCLFWPASVAVGQGEPEIRQYFRAVRIDAGETNSDVALFAGQISISGRPRFPNLLAGAGILTLLQLIPVAGIVVMLLIIFLAPGSVVVSGLGRDPDWLVKRLHRRRAGSTQPGP